MLNEYCKGFEFHQKEILNTKIYKWIKENYWDCDIRDEISYYHS